MGNGHLKPECHGSDVFAVLGRAELKLSLTLAGGEHLSRLEREVLAQALDRWAAGMSGDQSESVRREAETAVAAIGQKLRL